MKLNKSSRNLTGAINVTQDYIEYKLNSDSLIDKGSLSLIKYTHKADNIHNYEWTNFQNIGQFGSFIINSNRFPIMEYIYNLDNDLQNIPRIQSFMKGHINEYNENIYRHKSQSISAIARPLLLILQEDFWGGLMKLYFKYLHPARPILNLANFDPKTASEHLLSAIYFAGSVIQSNLSNEITSYMHNYAIFSIKKILFKINLSCAQAIEIYSYAFYLNGNHSLSRACLSHFGRMCHALGINIDRKNIPILDQSNREHVYNIVKLYCNLIKLEAIPRGLVSQDDEFDLDVYEPKHHYPNSCLKLFNSDFESTIYSVFCCQFAKISNFSVAINSKFCKYESKTIEKKIEALNRKTIKVYNDAKLALESLINKSPEYKNQIMECLKYLAIAN
ncbi:hypothetical protein CONCODRAFT_6342 [Conidiobolus coronatus NRRL 28638]|uniref:Transcription factor domain-containing protein n=1 Tax=Conidiobolus coronatus (strain ATCC 28846 / CBS 209.66 / NRRL 28638) TaxID=796925 RepID=A0A137P7R2_CONC2|nr:hypothetical protein CONCODRAFT_6342 [Conidiobolus coronatus NRRL 28638]|eukprot:KXN71035.1 hypothetical protein CONCODRAFT_6342 [Conidiobolus coronatus NRRL 28638]